MAKMASWGSKRWVVSSKKVAALQGLNFSYSQIADGTSSTKSSTKKKSKKTTKTKKTKSKRKKELFELNFTTTLHSGAGVDIWKEINSWKKLVTKVNYFYLNNKLIYPKQLQLRKVGISEVKLDDLGRMRLATLSFDFKEYDPSTTSVKVGAKKSAKSKKNATKNIKVGSYVKLIGSKYVSGDAIPDSAKKRSYKVSQIKQSQNKVLLSGISKWAYLNEITLI